MKVCYIILHYKNICDTVKCIDSLHKTAGDESRFIIVDNGSGDGSGEKLKKLYYHDLRCNVLLLEKNIGFSKGNNIGYQFAKEHYSPDFMVVANNDVVFYQLDFEKHIVELYERTKFDVLGPDIYIPSNREHQSPLFKNAITADALEEELKEYRNYAANPQKFLWRLKLHASKDHLCSRYPFIRAVYSKLRRKDNLDYKKEYENVGLQGSCLIVSSDYMTKEEKMFDPEPFLYCEEVFLFYKCQKKGYKIVYSPLLCIRHEEAASFKNVSRNSVDRAKFMLIHHVRAREMLLKYIRSQD